MKNLGFFENIERYINNDLTTDQKRTYEEAMANDPELAQMVEAHRLASQAIDLLIEQSLRVDLKKMNQEYKRQRAKAKQPLSVASKSEAIPSTTRTISPSSKSRWMPLLVAASLFICLSYFGLQWLTQQDGATHVATTTEQIEPTTHKDPLQLPAEETGTLVSTETPTSISEDEASTTEERMASTTANRKEEIERKIALKKKEIEAAQKANGQSSETIADATKELFKSDYDMAYGLYQDKQYDKAIAKFKKIIANSNNDKHYKHLAEGYLLLSYVANKETKEPFQKLLADILKDEKHPFHSKAQTIKLTMDGILKKLSE